MAKSENNLTAVLQDTADAIKSKKGTSAKICPRDFADEIASIPTGITPTGTLNITSNKTYDVTQYASANVNVPGSTPTGKVIAETNGEYDVTNYATAEVTVGTSLVVNHLAVASEIDSNYLDAYVSPIPTIQNDNCSVSITVNQCAFNCIFSDISEWSSTVPTDYSDTTSDYCFYESSDGDTLCGRVALHFDSSDTSAVTVVAEPAINITGSQMSTDEWIEAFEAKYPGGLDIYNGSGDVVIDTFSWSAITVTADGDS